MSGIDLARAVRSLRRAARDADDRAQPRLVVDPDHGLALLRKPYSNKRRVAVLA